MVARIILTISIIFLHFCGLSQIQIMDSIRIDTIAQKRFLPTGIRIGTDIISLVKTQRQADFSGWEVNGDVDFYRYLFSVDYGKWERSFAGDSVSYNNGGRYWRVGVDANFLTKDPDRNVFFIGMRYARSRYSESMSIIADDSIWGVMNRRYGNDNLTARWYELTTGLKVKIWKIFWLGYTARFKFSLKKDENNEMLSHDIPGYGRTDKDTYWGFNYQVMLRIPLRPTKGVMPSVKKKKKS